MIERLLQRERAPFGQRVWEELDGIVESVARNLLAGRKILDIDGPFGPGMAVVADGDETEMASKEIIQGVRTKAGGDDKGRKLPLEKETGIVFQTSTPVTAIYSPFNISMRNVIAFEEEQTPLDTAGVIRAVKSCALVEDTLIFHGHTNTGPGLLNAKGVSHLALGDWSEPQTIIADITAAVDLLDENGVPDPLSLVLGPSRYNALFVNQPGSDLLIYDQLTRMLKGNIHKSNVLGEQGILLAPGVQPASLLVGQDMTVGFRPWGLLNFEFLVLESVALQLNLPEAVVSLG